MYFLSSVEFSSVLILLLTGATSTKESKSALNYLLAFGMVFGCFLFVDVLLRSKVSLHTLFVSRGVLGLSVIAFSSKLPLMGLHQWLPRAHVECTAMGSAVLRGVFLKLRVAMLNYQMPFSFIAVRLVLTFISTVVMASTVDFKIFVAFSSISHMTLVFTGFYTNIYVRVLIYLVVHTLLSAAMFWLYSKEYGSVGTRLFSTFGGYSSSWLMFLWLGLPFFPVFITELFVMAMFSYMTRLGFVLLFTVLFLFCVVLLAFINRGVVASGSVYVTSQRKFHLMECSLIFIVGWILI
jgi:NADH:ubiquinone oxidoreductase subunit 4 (subunit M)